MGKSKEQVIEVTEARAKMRAEDLVQLDTSRHNIRLDLQNCFIDTYPQICVCGTLIEYSGYGALYFECPVCRRLYALSHHINYIQVPEAESAILRHTIYTQKGCMTICSDLNPYEK